MHELISQVDLEGFHSSMQIEMECISERLRKTILKCDAKNLLGFLWWSLLSICQDTPKDDNTESPGLDDIIFSLEYVHAVLCAHPAEESGTSREEEDVSEVMLLSKNLREYCTTYCMVAAELIPNDLLGSVTREMAFHAMIRWVTIRGNRYQCLEGEFLNFILEPHDEVLRRIYGIGASEIAIEIQRAVDATMFGHMRAFEDLAATILAIQEHSKNEDINFNEAIEAFQINFPDITASAANAIAAVFYGGICNLSKTSNLPDRILEDLSYERGEEKDFFAAGNLCGTPMRRMPGRIKPLVHLDDGYYLCDANFVRDSVYRALQWGVWARDQNYKTTWSEKQKDQTEKAFSHIFSNQLLGAKTFTSIYYQDTETGQWVENDVLILLDDALIQIEVKAGVMTMHPPEPDFKHHANKINGLLIEAYTQSKRFFVYAASKTEVPIFQLVDGQYKEVTRFRLNNYRVVLPIGLTVETFAPFSAAIKQFPNVSPILGKFPFISMSIDNLFVLKRLLPTAGELLHYLSVRQAAGSIKNSFYFDEIDHLGAYIHQNRFDQCDLEKTTEENTLILHNNPSEIIDKYFGDLDWQTKAPPCQIYPSRLKEFLNVLDINRKRGFLFADHTIRDFGEEERRIISDRLEEYLPTLAKYPSRWFSILNASPILVWMQRVEDARRDPAHAAASLLATSQHSSHCTLLIIYANRFGRIENGATEIIPAVGATAI